MEDFNFCWYQTYVWGISFNAVLVFGLGKDLFFESVQGCCESSDLLINCEILIFKVSLENHNLRKHLLLTSFENFDNQNTSFSKKVPNFCRLC